MKRINKIVIAALPLLLGLSACNSWLDELPDKRAELDTPEKIAQMLVSAYATEMPTVMFELMSDSYTDAGIQYSGYTLASTVEESYFYRDITEIAWDCPQMVWQNNYKSIASANQALQAIEELGNPESVHASKGEALLCRAYAHFTLVNTFSQAYNPETSDKDLGIPYIESPETEVKPTYTRGTVAEVYAKIARDIEEALPLITDNYAVPAYHFNRRAANAFAARFFLFYGEYQKAVDCATAALGDNPSKLLRDIVAYRSLGQPVDQSFRYHSNDESCNFLIQPLRSLWGRDHNRIVPNVRFGHSTAMANQTYRHYFPWGGSSQYGNSLWQLSGGGGQNLFFAKCLEIFEITNPTAQSGTPHIVLTAFTADETLAVRAEANAMLKNYDQAARDLSIWYEVQGGRACTAQEIADWYSIDRTNSIRYKMESKFNLEPGMQENLVRAALAIRRIEGMFMGGRWLDIKRHGIEVVHKYYVNSQDQEEIVLAPYDLRAAIQLPADVLLADLPANPR